MKVLTLTQPWASLVACNAKAIKTRSWKTDYRGPIAIHAAKGFPGEAKRFCEASTVCDALGWPRMGAITQESLDRMARHIKSLPLGSVIATATLIDVRPVELINLPEQSWERLFGNYEPDRYGWFLGDVVAIDPVPAKGALGLWEWTGAKKNGSKG